MSLRDGSIVVRPRQIDEYPLLRQVYTHHDLVISEALPAEGAVLEVACGNYVHPETDVGLDALEDNASSVEEGIVGDARRLPFEDESFSAVIGRRFLHHVPASNRPAIVAEVRRVLEPDGRFVVIEGTPGLYRTIVKGCAYRLGLLGEDHDEYGHLKPDDLHRLIAGEFEVDAFQSMGSPLMPLSIVRSRWVEKLTPLLRRTQLTTWWTFCAARRE